MRDVLRRARVHPLLNWATSLLRALPLPRDFLAKHLPRCGRIRFDVPGAKLTLVSAGDDWVSTQVFWKGLEEVEPDALLFMERAREAEVTIDVGAHIGLYSLVASVANRRGRVLAFEPHPRVFSRLYANVEASGRQNVECIPVAVGDADGLAPFHFAPIEALPSSSGLNAEFFAENNVPVESQLVPVVTLDRFCELRGERVDLVKIDTETTEPAVLRGMRGILKRDRPEILCEVLDSTEEIKAILGPLGYRFTHLGGRNYLCAVGSRP